MRPGKIVGKSLALTVYRSRLLARALFGIEFGPLGPKEYYFDVTTIALARRVSRLVGGSDRVLDLGTGSHAVIGLTLWKNTGCKVTCADSDREIVASAKRNVERNEAPIEVVRLDLFQNVAEPFDVVVFNPPYIHTVVGEGWDLSDVRRSQWDGGEEGTRTIAAFLSGLAELPQLVTGYLGVNALFVPRERILPLVRARPGLSLDETWRSLLLPVEIHVVRNKCR
jgi:methylase of polypeptide subunit release factors